MKLIFRWMLAVFLLLIIVSLSYCCGKQFVTLLAEMDKEPYLCISPEAVDPAHEGRKVQLEAPAYTDEWLELPDIGVRCQALKLKLSVDEGRWVDGRYVEEEQYRGHPLRGATKHAQRIRMGAFSLELNEYGAGRLGNQEIPMELIHLPEAWQPYCRVVQSECYESPYYLNLELEDEPPCAVRCSMVANGTPVVVRGIQRGNEISPVHGMFGDAAYFRMSDESRMERLRRDTLLAQGVILMVPALLLGVFRLLGCRKAGRSAPLAIYLMLVLESLAFMGCGGWQYVPWACLAAAVLAVCLWQIARVVRGMEVSAKGEACIGG